MPFINGFEIDVFVSEGHNYSSQVTNHPVENGADVADHVRPQPPVITLQGIVSDTPFGDLAERRNADTTIRDFLPSLDAYQRMLEIREARQPVTIESSLGTHENMVLENLNIPRSAASGDALRFTATFKQIEIVQFEEVDATVTIPRAKSKVNLGARASQAAGETPPGSNTPVPAPNEQRKSILADLAGF